MWLSFNIVSKQVAEIQKKGFDSFAMILITLIKESFLTIGARNQTDISMFKYAKFLLCLCNSLPDL